MRPLSFLIRTRRRRVALGLFALLGLGLYAGRSQIRTVLQSLYFLDGLAHLEREPWLGSLLAHRVQRLRESVRLADGEALGLDVYRPQAPGRWPALLIVPGFTKQGLEDPRMVALSRLVAGAGMVVVLPELTELFEYRWSVRIAERIEAAFEAMAQRPEVRPDRLGLFGISISGGLALASATRPSIAGRLSYAIAFAPFHDYSHMFEFVLTGRYRSEGQVRTRKPSPFSRWICLYNYLHLALAPEDPEFAALREVIRLRIYEESASADALESKLSPQKRELLRQLEAQSAPELEALAGRVIEESRSASLELSPHARLCDLKGRLFVLHGSDDDVLPYTETVELAEHCKSCPELRCDVLLTGLYSHADMDTPFQSLWHMLRYEIPELARYYAFLYRVLRCMLAP
jgi:acetyl esterase/lipase